MKIDGEEYKPPEPVKLTRWQKRHQPKNRLFTKKGYTRVIKVDGPRALNIPTKIGSSIDKAAKKNAKKFRKDRKDAAKNAG
jgi:hypothetical protein